MMNRKTYKSKFAIYKNFTTPRIKAAKQVLVNNGVCIDLTDRVLEDLFFVFDLGHRLKEVNIDLEEKEFGNYDILNCLSLDGSDTVQIRTLREVNKEDVVNHPSHYETGKFECFDIMREIFGDEAVMNFCICNAFKYIYRHKNKNGLEDLQKAIWYLKKYEEIVKESNPMKDC